MRILISGASIAGPVLAYWLTRYGATVTVVERSPALRKSGGHAIDLVTPAMEISEKMGVLALIEGKATGTNRMTVFRPGARRPVTVDLAKMFRATADRHVEIMRDDLCEIYYEATRNDVEYVFGDSITSISPAGEVAFENGVPRRFDLVVGADGLHSNVRRLVFGEESRFRAFIGAYLAVLSLPNDRNLDGEYLAHLDAGRTAVLTGTRHMEDARAAFLFRSDRELHYYKDASGQKQLLREVFEGMHRNVDCWLAELDSTPAFYFDSITQLRMQTWSHGRVTLVGDAGYCPGPALGASTSLAVLGAYVLAGELAEARGDHVRGYASYEREMARPVHESRVFAMGAAKRLIPNSRHGVWALVHGARLLSALPAGVSRGLAQLNATSVRLHASTVVKNYSAGADQLTRPLRPS